MVAANGPDAITSALKEAQTAGIKIIYVDSPANLTAEATFSTNNEAAGKTAGETMIAALTAAGVTEGSIGIVNVNAATDSTVKREAGFRSAFEGSKFTLLETQYGEGDAAKSQTIAENYITQGVVGIFGCNEGSTAGTGNAIKASGKSIIGVGFDKSDVILGLIKDGYLLATMRRINDLPIRSKFILLYLLGVLLPIAILLGYVLTNVSDEIRARETLNARQSLERVFSTMSVRGFRQAIIMRILRRHTGLRITSPDPVRAAGFRRPPPAYP